MLDYVEAMWRIYNKISEDYVIATGVTTYIRDFVIMAFEVGVTLTLRRTRKETATVAACSNPL
jgi:GDPmannose 4,6-dehydratase